MESKFELLQKYLNQLVQKAVNPRLNTLFKWNGQTNQLEETGVPSKLREKISKAAGVAPRQFDEMAQNRQKILESLVQRNIDDIDQVSTVVQNYYAKM